MVKGSGHHNHTVDYGPVSRNVVWGAKASTGVKIFAFSPSKWCILMHSGARFRPTRPITAIMMFMTSAEV